MSDIFISYRRDDTSGYAGRLYDQIGAHFGADHVFMDVEDITPGSDFVQVLEQQVGTCDALIALIGKNWLTLKDDQNRPRLGNSDDFVSVEILAALKRNVDVIPVLVGGAKMPLQRDLPESLKQLSRRQALEISDARFARDTEDLIAALERTAGAARLPARKRTRPAMVVALLLLGLVLAGLGLWRWQKGRSARQASATQVTTGDPGRRSDAGVRGAFPALANENISGKWEGTFQKNGSRFNVLFTFEVSGDKLFGKVEYPTGDAGILDGKIGNGELSFTTRHTPQFASSEATIRIDGRISGDEIEFVMQDESGLAKGVAHRVTRDGAPEPSTR